jgi:hypothetical protein
MHKQSVVLQINFCLPVFFAKQRGPQSKISVKILLLLFVDHRQLFGCLGRQAAGSNRSALVSFPGSTGYRLQFQTPAYKRQVATYAGGFPAYRFPRGKRIRSLHWALFSAPLGAGPSIPGCQWGLIDIGVVKGQEAREAMVASAS